VLFSFCIAGLALPRPIGEAGIFLLVAQVSIFVPRSVVGARYLVPDWPAIFHRLPSYPGSVEFRPVLALLNLQISLLNLPRLYFHRDAQNSSRIAFSSCLDSFLGSGCPTYKCLVSYPPLCYAPLARGGLSAGDQVPDSPEFSLRDTLFLFRTSAPGLGQALSAESSSVVRAGLCNSLNQPCVTFSSSLFFP